MAVGLIVGFFVGLSICLPSDGLAVVGILDGTLVGKLDGLAVLGLYVGTLEGIAVVGSLVGTLDKLAVVGVVVDVIDEGPAVGCIISFSFRRDWCIFCTGSKRRVRLRSERKKTQKV